MQSKQHEFLIEDIENLDASKMFESFLEAIKQKRSIADKALCEQYHLDKKPKLSEIADVYDIWEFQQIFDTPGWYNYEKGLYEFLNYTTPVEMLIERLSSEIPSFNHWDPINRADIWTVYFNSPNSDDSTLLLPVEEDKIKYICTAFGWFDSGRWAVTKGVESPLIAINFRCNYTFEVTDKVYGEDCPKWHPEAGILYHVCPKFVWDNKIKKTGLLPKTKKKHNRNYLPRIYFFYLYQKQDMTNNIKSLMEGISKEDKELHDFSEWVVIKVNLKRARIKYQFYSDPEYLFATKACFTYETIHPRCLELIDIIKI